MRAKELSEDDKKFYRVLLKLKGALVDEKTEIKFFEPCPYDIPWDKENKEHGNPSNRLLFNYVSLYENSYVIVHPCSNHVELYLEDSSIMPVHKWAEL